MHLEGGEASNGRGRALAGDAQQLGMHKVLALRVTIGVMSHFSFLRRVPTLCHAADKH